MTVPIRNPAAVLLPLAVLLSQLNAVKGAVRWCKNHTWRDDSVDTNTGSKGKGILYPGRLKEHHAREPDHLQKQGYCLDTESAVISIHEVPTRNDGNQPNQEGRAAQQLRLGMGEAHLKQYRGKSAGAYQ